MPSVCIGYAEGVVDLLCNFAFWKRDITKVATGGVDKTREDGSSMIGPPNTPENTPSADSAEESSLPPAPTRSYFRRIWMIAVPLLFAATIVTFACAGRRRNAAI